MHNQFTISWILLFLHAALILSGCNGGGDSREPPIGPNLDGNWVGRYFIMRSSDSREMPLTATIRHDGDSIRIMTSLQGVGANFAGTIKLDGSLTLTDGFDGETWTTFFRKATPTNVQIADFLFRPEVGADSPLQVIELNRVEEPMTATTPSS